MRTLAYRLSRLRSNPLPVIAIAATAVLAYVIVGPVVSVLAAAFVAHAGDPGIPVAPGEFTLHYFGRMFSSAQAERLFWVPLANTIQLTLLTTVVTIALGVTAGWIVARTDVWGGHRWMSIMLLAYMVPSWAFAQTWLTLFKNESAAGANGILEGLGISTPDWLAYGLVPSALVLALHTFPMVMILSVDAFGRVDAAQEESARLLRAGRGTILMRVVLPSIRPAVVSATLLIAASAVGDFGVPYVLGVPAGWNVLATSLYGELHNSRVGTQNVLAIVITLLGLLLISADGLLSRGGRRFETLKGGTTRAELTRLGPARPIAAAWLVILAIVSFVGPLFVLAFSTFVAHRGKVSLTDLTLDWWWGGSGDRDFPRGLLQSPEFWNAAFNSVWIAALVALCAAVIGMVVAVLVKHSPGPVGLALRQITFLPHLLPGISLAAGLIALFVVPRGPIPALYGTFALIVIGLVISELPFTTRTGLAAVSQLGSELEDAARVAGAGWWTSLRTIVAPLMRRSLTTAMIFPFISAMKDLTMVVMLSRFVVPGFLPALALDLNEKGVQQAANGVTLVITLVAVLGGVLARKLGSGSAGAALAA